MGQAFLQVWFDSWLVVGPPRVGQHSGIVVSEQYVAFCVSCVGFLQTASQDLPFVVRSVASWIVTVVVYCLLVFHRCGLSSNCCR